MASVRNGLRSDASPSEPSPRTADEFATRFLEVEKMIESFLHKYDSGQLEQLGWDASASLPLGRACGADVSQVSASLL